MLPDMRPSEHPQLTLLLEMRAFPPRDPADSVLHPQHSLVNSYSHYLSPTHFPAPQLLANRHGGFFWVEFKGTVDPWCEAWGQAGRGKMSDRVEARLSGWQQVLPVKGSQGRLPKGRGKVKFAAEWEEQVLPGKQQPLAPTSP